MDSTKLGSATLDWAGNHAALTRARTDLSSVEGELEGVLARLAELNNTFLESTVRPTVEMIAEAKAAPKFAELNSKVDAIHPQVMASVSRESADLQVQMDNLREEVCDLGSRACCPSY